VPTVADLVTFAEKYVTTPDGQPFSLDGREWVREHYFRALGGWKLWPVDADKLCSDCGEKANTLTETYGGVEAHSDCLGLKTEPILLTFLHLKRQKGKTFNTAGWSLARVFKQKNESIAMLAGSEDQVARLFNKNYRRPVENNKKLADRCRVLGTRLVVDKNNSDIEILPTAISSVGDTRTVVVLDEARDVPADVAVAMLPTLFARGGWECAAGHFKTFKGVDDPNAPQRCSVCRKQAQPWFGVGLIMSSAGELTDSENDWFAEHVAHWKANPHPNVHVYDSDDAANPKVAQKVVGAMGDILSAVPSTKVYADIEIGGEFRRKGDDVVGESDLNRCTDRKLANFDACAERCVGFLDTSTKVDKTALVILAEDSERSTSPWEYVYQARLDYWDPAKLGGVINPEVIERFLVALLPGFPKLVRLPVDTRGMPWADAMVRSIKAKHPTLARVVQPWNMHADESERGWAALQQRILTRPDPTIRLQDDKEQRREFKGVRFSFSSQSTRAPKVVDRNRRVSHKDITEALATCCFLVSDIQLKGVAPSMSRMREISTSVSERINQLRAPRVAEKRYEDGW
jgi:hypothetical protein